MLNHDYLTSLDGQISSVKIRQLIFNNARTNSTFNLTSRFCDSEISVPNTEEVNTSMTGDETNCLGSREVEDIDEAATSSRVPITSQEVARLFKAAFDPLTEQLQNFCDRIKKTPTGHIET